MKDFEMEKLRYNEKKRNENEDEGYSLGPFKYL